MSDGSFGGKVAESVTGVIGGAVKTVGDEVKELGKAAVGQATNAQSTNPQQSQTPNRSQGPYIEPGNAEKIAKIRSGLDMLTPQSPLVAQQQEQPQGPIAEHTFRSPSLQQFGTVQAKKQQALDVTNARHEQGRNAKG